MAASGKPKRGNEHRNMALVWIVIGASVLLLYYRDSKKKVQQTEQQLSTPVTAGGPGYVAQRPLFNYVPVSPAATIGATGGYGGNSLLNVNGQGTMTQNSGSGPIISQGNQIPYLNFMNGQAVQG